MEGGPRAGSGGLFHRAGLWRGGCRPSSQVVLALAFLLLALSLVIAFVGLGRLSESTAQRLSRGGAIRIGYAEEPPFAFRDRDGRVSGEAPEVARAVWQRLGVSNIEWHHGEFSSLIALLRAGRIDMLASGMFIRPERQRLVLFSSPTASIRPGLLVKAGNPLALHRLEDIAARPEARLAILAGAVEGEDARRAGIPAERILSFPDPETAVRAFPSGAVDALALSAPSVQQLARLHAGLEKASPVVGREESSGLPAFAFRREDKLLRDRFNRILHSFLGSEPHLALVAPFGFTREDLPPSTTSSPGH